MQSPHAIRRAALLAAFVVSTAACGGSDAPAGVIPREKFVAANVAVRSLPDSATPATRAAVLRRHGVTERQMKTWVTAQARQPEVLAKAWEEIAFKLDSAGGAPPPTPVTPTPTPAGSMAPVPPVRPPGQPARAESVRMVPPPPPPAPNNPQGAGVPGRRRPIKQVQ